MASGKHGLLSEIEAGALDPSADLPALLRRCVALGGATGSESLRAWATLELKGYPTRDQLPPYRIVAAPLELDGVSGNFRVTGQLVPAGFIPPEVRDVLDEGVHFSQPIAEIADLLQSGRANGESIVRLAPPSERDLTRLVNGLLAKADPFPIEGLPPAQLVERMYWSVSLSSIARILDVVRTTLMELVAEMRAGTPRDAEVPSREVAEQAVAVAIHGSKNRIVVNQAGPDSQAVAGSGPVSLGGAAESPQRAAMWWAVGIAGIVAAVAAVLVLLV